MYRIADYGAMLKDSVRMSAYVQALRQTVTPNSIVLDIGTGTGIFALIACQFGAKKVYAIEPSNVIQIAKEIACANGYSNKIEFIQDLSTQINLPEKANIIISDIRGVLPLFQKHIPVIADARKRLLAPDGILIPQQDTLWATVVETPELYQDNYAAPWGNQPYGLTMQSAQGLVTNTWRKSRLKPEQLLVEPQCWSTLDYTARENPDVKARLNWTVRQSGIAHGLGVWFDTTLVEGVGFSNSPDQPEAIYGEAFFPLSMPVSLFPGDTISVSLQADLVGDDYIWRWHSQVFSQGNRDQVKVNFQQSTFFGQPLSLKELQKQADSYQPVLNSKGKILQLILQLMNENKTLGTIADQLIDQFPQSFATWQEALSYLGEISQKYSQ